MQEVRLTTIDNPYNPFTDFKQWFLYDVEKGYNTCGYLDRVSHVTDDMSSVEVNKEIERAIDEIIKYDFTGKYVKVFKDSENKII